MDQATKLTEVVRVSDYQSAEDVVSIALGQLKKRLGRFLVALELND